MHALVVLSARLAAVAATAFAVAPATLSASLRRATCLGTVRGFRDALTICLFASGFCHGNSCCLERAAETKAVKASFPAAEINELL